MATLVFSAVGTILGGPIGGAIGGLLGQGIDQQLLGPGPRRGPRLGDLSVQTSTYGTAIPRVYGKMRVAGSVIWATEIKEESRTLAGGKGQPDLVAYSYSASFAVALSSRRVQAIRRIWADGKLLRGEAGDFKAHCKFRFHPGTEDQQVDPLVASVEGIGAAPAYRGLAVAVFEDLQLADYGNRIPFLTFEVEADPEPPSLAAILADASAGRIACGDSTRVRGYAAHGGTVRAAIDPLVDHFAIPLFDDGAVLRSPVAAASITLDGDYLGAGVDEERPAWIERSQTPARSLPVTMTLGYYDPARDYQAGQARATIGRNAGPAENWDIPVVLDAADAKGLAESSLTRRWTRRDRVRVRSLPQHISLEPGTSAILKGVSGTWRIEQVTIDGLAVQLELRPWEGAAPVLPADPGRSVPSPDVVAAETRMALLDLPDMGLERPRNPVLVLAAANSSAGWRSVPIEIDVDGALSTSRTADWESVLGTTMGALAPGQSFLLDLAVDITVQLVEGEHWLESCSDEALVNGANLAAVGDEVLQFGRAEPLGGGQFRLSRLLRGRRGTEWAAHGHSAGEHFVLLQPAALRPIDIPLAMTGALVTVTARSAGDGDGTEISRAAGGEALRPPSPVHVTAQQRGDGALDIRWIRRSRDGWGWSDGTDVPLGEGAERYRVTLASASATIELESGAPMASFSAEQMATLGPGPASLAVVQVGDLGQSRPAIVSLSL